MKKVTEVIFASALLLCSLATFAAEQEGFFEKVQITELLLGAAKDDGSNRCIAFRFLGQPSNKLSRKEDTRAWFYLPPEDKELAAALIAAKIAAMRITVVQAPTASKLHKTTIAACQPGERASVVRQMYLDKE